MKSLLKYLIHPKKDELIKFQDIQIGWLYCVSGAGPYWCIERTEEVVWGVHIDPKKHAGFSFLTKTTSTIEFVECRTPTQDLIIGADEWGRLRGYK